MGIRNGRVVETTDAEGEAFRLAAGVFQLRCSIHNGGTWTLSSTDATRTMHGWRRTPPPTVFTSARTITIQTPTFGHFRVDGGTLGAQIEVIPTAHGLRRPKRCMSIQVGQGGAAGGGSAAAPVTSLRGRRWWRRRRLSPWPSRRAASRPPWTLHGRSASTLPGCLSGRSRPRTTFC